MTNTYQITCINFVAVYTCIKPQEILNHNLLGIGFKVSVLYKMILFGYMIMLYFLM